MDSLGTWFSKALPLEIKGRCELLWSEENPFYDTVIKVEDQWDEPGKSFHVHRLIIAIGSRRLASILYDITMSPIKIPFVIHEKNVSASIMTLVIEFLYTDDIKMSLEWPQVGGLYHAAKLLQISGLEEFCMNLIEQKLTCDKVLIMLEQICALTKETCKWPNHYYKELLNLCFTYIFRNGEVILRAKKFLDLSYATVESIIRSDFLICEEISVFNALKRWAKFRMNGNDNIENIRKVLRRPGDDDKSLGLVMHVRFPIMNSKTFMSIVQKPPNALLPNEVAEKVYQYYTISEPTGIFQEKGRYTEITDEIFSEFKEHVDELSHLLMPNGVQPVSQFPDTDGIQTKAKIKVEVVEATESSGDSIDEFSNNIKNDIKVEVSQPIKVEMTSNDSPQLEIETAFRAASAAGIEVERTSPIVLKRKVQNHMLETGNVKSIKIQKFCYKDPGFPDSGVYIKEHQKMSYNKIITECSKNPNLSKIVFNDIEVDKIGKLGKMTSPICLPNLTDFVLKANVGKANSKQEHLLKNLMNINLENYVFFYHENKCPQMRLRDLWTNKVTAELTFNGVTVLNINNPELTLNYTSNTSFYTLQSQVLTDIKVLNLGNCTMQKKNWLNENSAQALVELRLLCVKGLKINQILRGCSSLETCSVWWDDNQIPPLCFDDVQSKKFRYLSICGHLLKFNPMSKCQLGFIEEMCLCDCPMDPSFVEGISKRFPNLRKIYIMSRFFSPSPDLLEKLLSNSSVKEIGVWNFDSKSLEIEDCPDLKQLIIKLNLLTSYENELSFKVKRNAVENEWSGGNVTSNDLTKTIYRSFGFFKFYTYKSWLKNFWVKYNDY